MKSERREYSNHELLSTFRESVAYGITKGWIRLPKPRYHWQDAGPSKVKQAYEPDVQTSEPPSAE